MCVVKHWKLYTFTNSLTAGKVDHCVKPAIIENVRGCSTMHVNLQRSRLNVSMSTHCILFCGKSFVKVFKISQVPLQRTIVVSWRGVSSTTVFAKWFKARSVAADYLDELHVLALIASKLLHSFVCHLECIVQVVDDRDLAPVLQQAENSMTTCESCHRLEHLSRYCDKRKMSYR